MVLTFHRILSGCEEGSREAWQEFLSNYTPVMLRILGIYLPYGRSDAQNEIWRETLGALSVHNLERLRTFDRQSEREFLVDLRVFLLGKGSARLEPGCDAPDAPEPTANTVSGLLKGLPLLHQVVLFLKLAGYSDGTLDGLLRITPAIAQKGLERLQANYSIVLRREQDVNLWPAAWMGLLRHAWAAKAEGCPPLRQFVRILDGQTGWYEKDPLEQHVAECLHCLERWTALREIVYWKREAKPLRSQEVDAFLSCLPVQAEGKTKRSFLRRIFG